MADEQIIKRVTGYNNTQILSNFADRLTEFQQKSLEEMDYQQRINQPPERQEQYQIEQQNNYELPNSNQYYRDNDQQRDYNNDRNRMNYALVTGASSGMGLEYVRELARRGYNVIVAALPGRTDENGNPVGPPSPEVICDLMTAEFPGLDFIPAGIDLARTEAAQDLFDRVFAVRPDAVVEVLINNAGIINRYFKVTEDGYENTMATNFVGPMALTESLLPHFAQGAHIVSMVSLTCGMTRLDKDFLTPRKEDFHQLRTYARSKLALLLYTLSLSQRVSGRIHVNMADPGIVNSNMISMGRWFDPLADVLFRPFCKSPENGVAPAVRALLTDKHQRFFIGNPKTGSRLSGDRPIPKRYWKMLEDWDSGLFSERK